MPKPGGRGKLKGRGPSRNSKVGSPGGDDIAAHRLARAVGEHHKCAAPVVHVGAAFEQSGVGHSCDPAQCGGGRNRGGNAQARHRNTPPLQFGGVEIEQHIPTGILEQRRAEELVAQTPRTNRSTDIRRARFSQSGRRAVTIGTVADNRRSGCVPLDLRSRQSSKRLGNPRDLGVQSFEPRSVCLAVNIEHARRDTRLLGSDHDRRHAIADRRIDQQPRAAAQRSRSDDVDFVDA